MGLGKAYIAGRRQPTAPFMARLGAESLRHPRAPASRPPILQVRAPAGTAPATPRARACSRPWCRSRAMASARPSAEGAGLKRSPPAIASTPPEMDQGVQSVPSVPRLARPAGTGDPRRDGIACTSLRRQHRAPEPTVKATACRSLPPARGDARGPLVKAAPDTAWPSGRARRPRAQASRSAGSQDGKALRLEQRLCLPRPKIA